MKLSLKYLILLVAVLSIGFTLVSSISSGYRVSQTTLIDSTLEMNRVYAQKVAATTDKFMKSTFQTLEYSAKEVAVNWEENNSEALLLEETERLFNQSGTFNSVIITSAAGKIIAASPETLNILGKNLSSPGAKQALVERKPIVSKPFMSITNRLIVFISHPIFDREGNYLGYIGGSIYLLEDNILKELLGEHFYKDGSYLYVVDEEGRLLYHPDPTRIGDIVKGNPVINETIKGNSGTKRIVNTDKVDMLAGYGYVPTTRWGIVSQRPTDVTLLPSNDMRNEMMLKTAPFLLLSFILIIFIANRIAAPLEKLGNYADSSTKKEGNKKEEDINAWYYEAIQLKKALVNSIDYFEDRVNYFIHESTTDPLTGLLNRRAMTEKAQKCEEEGTPYSIILFDIDRFKRVNDTYGHSVGDEVLKFLATEMRAVSRSEDICCRYGGEEFILLMPETTKQNAYEVAERLRKKLEVTISPSGEVITISSGIASYPECAQHSMKLIEVADECLYKAKNTGRNKSIMADCK